PHPTLGPRRRARGARAAAPGLAREGREPADPDGCPGAEDALDGRPERSSGRDQGDLSAAVRAAALADDPIPPSPRRRRGLVRDATALAPRTTDHDGRSRAGAPGGAGLRRAR